MPKVRGPKQVRVKHLGLVFAFLVIGAVVGLTLAIHHGFSARDTPSGGERIIARLVRSLAVPSYAKDMKNPVPDIRANLDEARAHWADHCASCHANNGSGETEIGRNLYPKAPDMRVSATQNLTDGEIYFTIKNGIRLTGMPAWGEPGDADEESWKLVRFIRHLPRLTPEEEKEMEQLNPKGPGERKEEQDEEDFLKGSDSTPKSGHQHEVKPKEKK